MLKTQDVPEDICKQTAKCTIKVIEDDGEDVDYAVERRAGVCVCEGGASPAERVDLCEEELSEPGRACSILYSTCTVREQKE